MRKIKLLPGFTNVGVGNRAILQIPLGEIYHVISLPVLREDIGGNNAMTVAEQITDIASIQLKVNDNVVQDWIPAQLHAVNGTMGAAYAARDGFIDLYFSRPDRRTLQGEEAEGWGTADIQNMSLEVTFLAPVGLLTVTIGAYAIVDTAANRQLRSAPIRHIRRLNFAPAAAGVAQLDKIVKGVNIFYSRLHFMSALVTNVKVSVDDRVVWHDLPLALVGELFTCFGLVLQATTYTVAFDLSKQLTDQLATFYPSQQGLPAAPVQDLRVDVTVTGAGAFDVVLEQYRFLG